MKYYILVGHTPIGIIGTFSGTEQQAEEYRSKLSGASMFEVSKQTYDLRKQFNSK